MTGRLEARTTSLPIPLLATVRSAMSAMSTGGGVTRPRDAPYGEQGQHDDHAGDCRRAQQRDRRSRLGRRVERLLQPARRVGGDAVDRFSGQLVDIQGR